jgi:MaoC like domain
VNSQTESVQVLTTTDVLALEGGALGPSAWLPVAQDRVGRIRPGGRRLALAHDDVERASRGPFGGTIAHAHLTLSLIPHLFSSLVGFADPEDAMFYGYNRVRFPTAVLAGSSVRMRLDIVNVVELVGGEQLTVDLLIEIDGTDRPACPAQALFRHYHVKAPD